MASRGFTVSIDLAKGDYIELYNGEAEYWDSEGKSAFKGPIGDLPLAVIDELVSLGVIKECK